MWGTQGVIVQGAASSSAGSSQPGAGALTDQNAVVLTDQNGNTLTGA